MSFTENVVNELMSAELQRTCCRKAMLYGLFINAQIVDERFVQTPFRSEQGALFAVNILKKQFSADADMKKERKASRTVYSISVKSKALVTFLQKLDGWKDELDLKKIVGFSCEECSHAFLRGVFVSCGTVNDPRKGYHIEFSVLTGNRANAVVDLISKSVLTPPKVVVRETKTGIYYKKNSSIFELLYYLGAVKSNFEVADVWVERDIRNNANRSTNCEASNISRAVAASKKHVEAIERLVAADKLPKLGEELQYTARLRLENPSTPLAELALMHEPPISKSGLNRRLSRILEEAENI